jgi:RHS repeat-associated protein
LSNLSWDYLDQLISATNGTFTSYYNYDNAGSRTRKVVEKQGGIKEERYYINGYEIYRKYTNNTLDYERKTLNISDDEKVFVCVEQKTGENEVVRYQYDNHLGSACLELDVSGAIISYEEYHPFGTTSYRSGRNAIEVSLKRYKYCGKERDEETGLYYYGMRYYAAWLCRFVSVDPLQFKYPYYTPYQYAGNKPITFIDLDGAEEKKPEDFKGFASLGGKGTAENPIELPEVVITANRVSDGGYMPYMSKFAHNGSAWDYLAAVDNFAIDIINLIPALWNSGVANFHSIKRGTWTQDITSELKGMWSGIKTFLQNEYEYTTTTPVDQQFIDAIRNLTSPQFVEFALPFVVGGAVSNFSKLTTVSKTTASTTANAAKGGVKAITQFSSRTIDDAVGIVMKDANKLNHLFSAKHNLGGLVNQLGGQENTIRAVLNAANGKLPASGVFNNIPVSVGGQTVFIRGSVIDGIPRLGTMFIP